MTEATQGQARPNTTRRQVLRWLIRIGSGAFAIALLLPALALQTLTQKRSAVVSGDVLVFATGDRAGTPVRVEDLQPGEALQAFPEGKADDQNNLIEVVQIASGVEGIVAYSAICTHLGCTVLPELTDEGYIPCPCHASLFDPADDAEPISGPANRPLPSLPIATDAGVLTAAGSFSGPVGPI